MKTKKITTSAIMIALSTVLLMVSKVIPSPWLQGGSITIASMAPIIAVSLIYGCRWGVASGFVFSLIQMITGPVAPPVQNFMSYFLVVFFDYVGAFSCLGMARLFFDIFEKKRWSIVAASVAVTTIRYICHIISGILIWNVYAEDQSVLWYSLTYNGSYMIPEIIITAVVMGLMSKFIMSKINSL